MTALNEALSKGTSTQAGERAPRSVLMRFLDLISSIRFGLFLLILLGILCFLGMVVMQQNVTGFDRYFAALTPAERRVLGSLGLFNIYHAWYFNLLLAALSMNIILSSIDRLPRTWAFVFKPNVVIPLAWLREQRQTAEIQVSSGIQEATRMVVSEVKVQGWRGIRTEERNGRVHLFAERGNWNRFGAYPVHVALLLIFLGGYLTSQLSAYGSLPLSPGQTTNMIDSTIVENGQMKKVKQRLPFDITCTDIAQRLIKKDGPIDAANTIDWVTHFTINDKSGVHKAVAGLNRPFDHGGYRFFQASASSVGHARSIAVTAKNVATGDVQTVTIARGGTAALGDGTRVEYADFRADFRRDQSRPNENTSNYPAPAAILNVTPPDGTSVSTRALGSWADDAVGAAAAGYTFRLEAFEKVSEEHVLSVQRDPGAPVVYVGFALLALSLAGVFLFSHQRVWAVIEPINDGIQKITLGGNTNRNSGAFGDRFERLAKRLQGTRRYEI